MKPFLFLLLAVALGAAEPKKGGIYSGGVVTCEQFQAAYHQLTGRYIAPPPERSDRALVRYSALEDLREYTWRTLSNAYGIRTSEVEKRVMWDPRFDCVAIALAANLELRARLMSEYWMAETTARRPACAIIFYQPADLAAKKKRAAEALKAKGLPSDNPPGIWAHALLFIVTDQGPVWWDPVTGLRMLTAEEIASVYTVTP